MIGAIIAGLICSNVWLWINLWNLKQTHFDFEHLTFDLLKEFAQRPAEDGASQSAEQPTHKV